MWDIERLTRKSMFAKEFGLIVRLGRIDYEVGGVQTVHVSAAQPNSESGENVSGVDQVAQGLLEFELVPDVSGAHVTFTISAPRACDGGHSDQAAILSDKARVDVVLRCMELLCPVAGREYSGVESWSLALSSAALEEFARHGVSLKGSEISSGEVA